VDRLGVGNGLSEGRVGRSGGRDKNKRREEEEEEEEAARNRLRRKCRNIFRKSKERNGRRKLIVTDRSIYSLRKSKRKDLVIALD
jgi:hypothetical protein